MSECVLVCCLDNCRGQNTFQVYLHAHVTWFLKNPYVERTMNFFHWRCSKCHAEPDQGPSNPNGCPIHDHTETHLTLRTKNWTKPINRQITIRKNWKIQEIIRKMMATSTAIAILIWWPSRYKCTALADRENINMASWMPLNNQPQWLIGWLITGNSSGQ